MTFPNRVTPTGALVAAPAHGTMLGNRGGRFHDPMTKTAPGRPWASKQWICCVLDFKNRRRDVWGPFYTEPFFCDEVTALAAGHRPCFECRRGDATSFAAAAMRARGLPAPPRAPQMDAWLHAERLNGRAKRVHRLDAGDLPDGAMLLIDDAPHALKDGRLLRWSFAGYATSPLPPPRGPVDALTPPTILGALRAGYRPRWHASAA